MAEAFGEEIDDPAAGLVTRDYLDKRLAEFEARFTWKMIGPLGVQIVIFSLSSRSTFSAIGADWQFAHAQPRKNCSVVLTAEIAGE